MSLSVDRYELGPVGTNCYVVRLEPVVARGSRRRSGRGRRRASAVLRRDPDHALALGSPRRRRRTTPCEQARGSTCPGSKRRFSPSPAEWFPEIPLEPYDADVLLDGGESLELAGIGFETINVPGHSPGHVAYYADGALFSGDVLFAGSVGRTDIPFGDWNVLVESIRGLIDRFPPETVVYSGHGPETTLGAELERNPFLDELRVS